MQSQKFTKEYVLNVIIFQNWVIMGIVIVFHQKNDAPDVGSLKI
jgi:hypothetical protein